MTYPHSYEDAIGYIHNSGKSMPTSLWYATYKRLRYYPKTVCRIDANHPCVVAANKLHDERRDLGLTSNNRI